MLKGIKDIKEGQEYWYSCVYFKHSVGQLPKTIKEVKPKKVKVRIIGNYLQVVDSNTGSQIYHPSYSSININWAGSDMYFSNFIFETEQEAWDSYRFLIHKEIERTKELCDKKIAQYCTYLRC